MKLCRDFLLIFLLLPLFLNGQENEIIVLGIVDASPPFMFVNEENDPDGFAIDLFTRMMGDLAIPYEIRVENFSDLYRDLLEGSIDIFPGMIYSKEREEVIYYPGTPLLTSWGELFVAESTFYTDITSIKGKTVGMVKGDLNGKNFIDFMKIFDIPYDYVEFDSFSELYSAIKEGRIYAGVASNQHQFLEPGIKATATIFSPAAAYAVTGREKGNIPVMDKLSDYLKELKLDPASYYYELEKNWYQPEAGIIDRRIIRIAVIASLIVLFLMLFLFLNIRYLRKEVKRQVEEIRQQKTEREKVALKNDFLSSISHELRTPMNIIANLTYLHSQTELTETQREQVNKIGRASRQLINIINNFLDFNRLEKNSMEQEKRVFSPRNELNEIIDMFQDEIREKSLKLTIRYENDLPPFLRGDSFKMTQILTNLISNAIKFSEKGAITLGVKTENTSAGRCLLTLNLKDQGIGIAKEKLSGLFEPYSQADNSISRRYGGSGLGLAISRQLVELLGGTIDVFSREGEGTEFKVTIPFDPADGKDLEIDEQSVRIHTFPGARILFVEDNPINREIGQELLRMAQISTITAENGAEALEAVLKEDLDLVLMDIQMPVMDGLTAAVKIREQEKKGSLKPLPIIALTAHFLQEDIQKAYEAGMNGHISKPVSIDKLNRVLEKWLGPSGESVRERESSSHGPVPPVPGFNMSDLTERFGGDLEIFYRSLEMFINDYRSFTKDLLENKENPEESLIRIHTLRGVLGLLGMEKWTEEWQHLEEQWRKASHYPAELIQRCAEFDDYLDLLNKEKDSWRI